MVSGVCAGGSESFFAEAWGSIPHRLSRQSKQGKAKVKHPQQENGIKQASIYSRKAGTTTSETAIATATAKLLQFEQLYIITELIIRATSGQV